MRLRAFLLVLLLISIVLPLPTHGDSEDCSAALPTRLAVGLTARTTFTSPSGTRLYESPGERSHRVAILANGTALNVVGGPTCASSMQWWQVRTRTGLAGWIGEGDEEIYQLEPWPLAIQMAQRAAGEIRFVQVKTDGGTARILNRFPVQPVRGSVQEVFPHAEWSPLQDALDRVLVECPASAPAHALDQWPADSGAMDVYPSPDGTWLLIVRHLWRSAPSCSPDPAPVYGIDRLSLISLSGEIRLLEIPANVSSPIYLDRFRYQPAEVARSARSRIEGVWWSPDNARAVLQIRYADLSNPTIPVFTYKIMVYDLASGMIADLGDGLHPSWDLTGERVQWFRRISPQIDQFDGEALYSAESDGSDLRGIPLPASATFIPVRVSPSLDATGLPWDDTGKQVIACTGANAAQSAQAAPCTAVAAFDLMTRSLSASVGVAPVLESVGYRAVRWLDETTLVWLPADPATMTLYLQSLQTGSITPLRLKTGGSAQWTLADIQPFPDGQTILVTVQDSSGATRYLTVNVGTGKVNAVQMPS